MHVLLRNRYWAWVNWMCDLVWEQHLLKVWLNSCNQRGITGKMKWGKRFQNENPIKEFMFLLDTWFAKLKEMDSVCKLHKSHKFSYMMICAIWYHLYNLNNVKSTHGECYFKLLKVTLSNGCFLRFFNLYKWYQIAQRVSYVSE